MRAFLSRCLQVRLLLISRRPVPAPHPTGQAPYRTANAPRNQSACNSGNANRRTELPLSSGITDHCIPWRKSAAICFSLAAPTRGQSSGNSARQSATPGSKLWSSAGVDGHITRNFFSRNSSRRFSREKKIRFLAFIAHEYRFSGSVGVQRLGTSGNASKPAEK
jgi:hypothetical protein